MVTTGVPMKLPLKSLSNAIIIFLLKIHFHDKRMFAKKNQNIIKYIELQIQTIVHSA